MSLGSRTRSSIRWITPAALPGGSINGHTLTLAYDPRGREVTRDYTRNASGGGVSSFRQGGEKGEAYI